MMKYSNKIFFLTSFVILFFLFGDSPTSEFLCAARKIQTPVSHQKERIKHSEGGGSLN
jgi:hypothetical protein